MPELKVTLGDALKMPKLLAKFAAIRKNKTEAYYTSKKFRAPLKHRMEKT
jgi:hypothetical protein